jgi:predicted nucleic acid-binding protein
MRYARRIVATADKIYADPSALLKLYLNEPESRAMATWRGNIRAPLWVTHHGRLELINGIGLAAHRSIVTAAIHDAALAALDQDFAQGMYAQADLLWRATLERASDISREFTRVIGCRSLDVLHVASALELGLRSFLTFDARQKQLARAVKLRLVVPA